MWSGEKGIVKGYERCEMDHAWLYRCNSFRSNSLVIGGNKEGPSAWKISGIGLKELQIISLYTFFG